MIFINISCYLVNCQKMAAVDPGSGKPAITDYYTLFSNSETNIALVLCVLHTGRTH